MFQYLLFDNDFEYASNSTFRINIEIYGIFIYLFIYDQRRI